jgi:hypothetical protein
MYTIAAFEARGRLSRLTCCRITLCFRGGLVAMMLTRSKQQTNSKLGSKVIRKKKPFILNMSLSFDVVL